MKKQLFFLQIAFAILLSSCGGGTEKTEQTGTTATTTAPHTYVRYNSNSEGGQKALKAMKKALDSMKKMNCTNPLSWYYQGAIHWVPDSILGKNLLCSSYQTKKDLKAAWDNCTHASGDASSFNFLAWHRYYIYYFEKIVRKLSGDPDFALPYWGYTDTTNVVLNRTLNDKLRDTTSSLFESARYTNVNQGATITDTAVLRALNLTTLFQKTDLFPFIRAINQAPHGTMHTYIGGGYDATFSTWNPIYQGKMYGLMVYVPSAGFDPVFWLHHSNIDRVWQQWTNSPNGKLYTLEDLKKYPWEYVFFDENGTKVTLTPEQVMNGLYNVDYVYDDTKTGPDSATLAQKSKPSLLLSAKIFADTLIRQKISKVVTGNSMSFNVKNDVPKFNGLLQKHSEPEKEILILLRVSFKTEPHNIYEVYVNLPDGVKPNPSSDYFAGFMSFFGAELHAEKVGGNMTETFLFEMSKGFAATNASSKPNFKFTIFNTQGKPADISIDDVSIIVK